MIEQRPPLLLRLKLLLRDVHPAVWRRITLADSLSIADLHPVVQLLMGWDDDHLHRFRIHGGDYGIAYIGGINFDEDAAAVSLSQRGPPDGCGGAPGLCEAASVADLRPLVEPVPHDRRRCAVALECRDHRSGCRWPPGRIRWAAEAKLIPLAHFRENPVVFSDLSADSVADDGCLAGHLLRCPW
jgi:hypothetical protein